MLRELSSKQSPAVQVCEEPLIDETGVFGYRMELLSEIDIDVATKYIPEVENAFQAIIMRALYITISRRAT
jgi:hypothetical protein